jgi:hypothetical protein
MNENIDDVSALSEEFQLGMYMNISVAARAGVH